MKIEDLLSLTITPARPESKPTGEANFAQHLQEAVAAASKETGAGQAPAGLELLGAIDPVAATNRAPAEVLDTVLSRLDSYREALARPDLPLKKLTTLVQNLEEDSQRLQVLAQTLPGTSPLKQVLEEAAALAYTESFKFNRGDYV